MEIKKRIQRFYKEYSPTKYKDGGEKLIDAISRFIINLNDKEKLLYYNYLIDIIREEDKQYDSFSLAVIENINDIKLNNKLFEVYKKKKGKLREDILITLLKLRYKEQGNIYKDFITEHYSLKPENSFHIIALYCYVFEDDGIKLMSDYFSKYMRFTNYSKNEISGKELFLFSIVKDRISILVKLLDDLNKDDANLLKKMFSNYLISDFGNDVDENIYKELFNIVNT